MNRKFFFIKQILILIITVFLLSCGKERPVLNIYNWGDYIDDTIISDFEKEFGVKINYDLFSTNEEMYVKIKQGGGNYDLACPSDYMIERMINENMLSELNHSNIPNMSLIDSSFKNLAFDPANKYSVPYMWGTLGVLYNSDLIDGELTSWGDLWNPEYSGLIGMYNSSRDSFAVALKYLGYSLNTTNINEINDAKDLLIKQKPLVLVYGEENLKDMLASNEIAIAVTYSGDYSWIIEENPQMIYIVPDEGSNIWFDNWVIIKDSPNKELAEEFINFLNRKDIAFRNADYVGYATPISSVKEMLDDEVKNDPAIYPSQDIIDKCEVFIDLADFNSILDKAWTEVKAAK